MTSERVATIEKLISEALDPVELLVKDTSHMHIGHAGAKDGRGHFDVRIVSDKFTGQSRIERHRMVYHALGPFIDSDIHALRINAVSPSDT